MSYKVSNVTQSEFTARELFDSTYAKVIVDKFNSGLLKTDKEDKSMQMLKSDDSK